MRFKTVFHDSIQRGEKTTTLRRWSRPMLRAGADVTAPGVGTLHILQVESIRWGDLGEADARTDGFESLADMRAMVRKIYPNSAHDGKAWYRVRFRLANPPPLLPLPPLSRSPKRLKPPRRGQLDEPADPCPDRMKLAAAIRTELDKAVRQTGS